MTAPVPEWVYRSDVDPLTVVATVCPVLGCPVAMPVAGWLVHNDDGSHTWDPYRDPKPSLLARIRALFTRGNR